MPRARYLLTTYVAIAFLGFFGVVPASADTKGPVDIQRLAGAKRGQGAVLRVLDSRTIVRDLDALVRLIVALGHGY